jgi:replicative DNA helicase
MNNPQVNWKHYEEAAREVIEQDKIESILKVHIPTGFNLLDEMIDGGFKPGELIILSAPTKQGKSTMAQTMTWNMAQNGKQSLWFSMEMSWQELTRKFLAMDELFKKQGMPSITPIHYPIENYLRGGEIQMNWIKETISESKRLNNTNFVVIDHLHFLLPLKDFNTNPSFLIGGIVREIKKIAVELAIPILLIAHTTKLDIDKTPDINSIRDSSFIAQESDFTMIMWRIRDKNASKRTNDEGDSDTQIVYTNKAWLSLEANRRNGRTGRIKLWHDGSRFNSYISEGVTKEAEKIWEEPKY